MTWSGEKRQAMREVADVPQHANSEHDKELCAFCLTLIIFFDLDRGLRRLGSISNITKSGVLFCGVCGVSKGVRSDGTAEEESLEGDKLEDSVW
jgi:hypothetical protein